MQLDRDMKSLNFLRMRLLQKYQLIQLPMRQRKLLSMLKTQRLRRKMPRLRKKILNLMKKIPRLKKRQRIRLKHFHKKSQDMSTTM